MIISDIVNVNDIVKVIANYMLPMTLLFTLVILKIFCKGEYFQLLILLKNFKHFFCWYWQYKCWFCPKFSEFFFTIFLIRHIFHPQSITRKRLSMPFIQKSQLAKVDAKMEESVSNQKKKPNGMNATAPIDIMDEAVTSCALFRTVR